MKLFLSHDRVLDNNYDRVLIFIYSDSFMIDSLLFMTESIYLYLMNHGHYKRL